MPRIPAQLNTRGQIHFWQTRLDADATPVDYDWATSLLDQIEQAKQVADDAQRQVERLGEALKAAYTKSDDAEHARKS